MNHANAPAVPRLLLALTTSCCVLATQPARALEEQAGEAKAIDACDKRLCTMLQGKDPKGEDLKCGLTKTWAKSTLKEADQATVKWGFGDARCSVQINMSREAIVNAVSSNGQVKLRVPPHIANCVVEQDGHLRPVTATVGPKIVFRDGKAIKIWINLINVDGPAGIKATLSAAAQLNDTIGLFHRAMLKSVNRYIFRHCPKYHPLTVSAAPPPFNPVPAKPAAKPSEPGQATPKKEGG